MYYRTNSYLNHPLSWRGRFSRLSYWAWSNLVTLLFFLIACANIIYLIYMPGLLALEKSYWLWLRMLWPTLIGALLLSYANILFTIRRLHDLNLSGWLFLLMYIPVIGSLFWLYSTLAKGTDGRNSYGFPRDTLLWEGLFGVFTAIIWLVTFGWLIGYVLLHPSAENMAVLSHALKQL